ncbi:hypothetical protein EDC01DRAFT_626901 [Geopyxis carbonaria]|nr:hypothetical protein EDC01DRAFT_626901 [Geopyxis carbonaria]
MATAGPILIPYSSIVIYLNEIIKFRQTRRKREDEDTLVICCSEDSLLQQVENVYNSDPTEPDLTPTLEVIAHSINLNVVFVPSFLHLRAYISTIQPEPPGPPGLLAIWGLIAAHHDTSELSAQGIGRTAAAVIDAGLRSGKRVVLGEGWCERQDCNNEEIDRMNWIDAEVPILNATVKADGLDGGVSARTVAVRGVLGRWFVFGDMNMKISIVD